jgi:hypothetical protein
MPAPLLLLLPPPKPALMLLPPMAAGPSAPVPPGAEAPSRVAGLGGSSAATRLLPRMESTPGAEVRTARSICCSARPVGAALGVGSAAASLLAAAGAAPKSAGAGLSARPEAAGALLLAGARATSELGSGLCCFMMGCCRLLPNLLTLPPPLAPPPIPPVALLPARKCLPPLPAPPVPPAAAAAAAAEPGKKLRC